MFITRASPCGESFAFGRPAAGCVSEGAGVAGCVNRDDTGGRDAVGGVNGDGTGGGVEVAEEATTSTLST